MAPLLTVPASLVATIAATFPQTAIALAERRSFPLSDLRPSNLRRSLLAAALLAAGWSGSAVAAPQVCFYEHINYQGRTQCVSSNSAWIGNAWNDRISSVKVPAGVKLRLYANSYYRGAVLTLTADEPN
ncbi:hypothetical protein DBR42_24330, partial [Pelomonas sp. HMWF004]